MPERIGRFEILRKIGEGGMGEVFKARDPQINRIVAIKLLREGFNTREMRDRFMLEAQSAGGLQNPYIVTIFELGEHHGAPFIVMEFLFGDPLDHLIRRRAPLTLLRKLELMEALCSGLGAAHRAGIIHRDVKPPNLMVVQDGLLKILDFGIARVSTSDKTKMGTLIGTPNYMSPEQLNGETIDTRTDIFAAGAVCYELLSYERAFPGNQTEAITRILARDPLSLLKLCPTLEPQIAAVVERALKKNPRERYQDLPEMRRDILRIKDRLKREAPETLSRTITAETLFGDNEQRSPTSASARMREELRRRSMTEVEAARRLFDQGEIAAALRRLETFTPANEFVTGALVALQERADEIQRESLRAAATARAMQSAQEAFERGDFEAAVRAADEALLVDERSTRAREVRRQARSALDEQRRYAALMQRVTSTIANAREIFGRGDRRSALDLLESFEPAHPEISAVLDELQAEDAAVKTVLAPEQSELVARARRAHVDAERAANATVARLAEPETALVGQDVVRPTPDPQAWGSSHAIVRRAALPAAVVVLMALVAAGLLLRPSRQEPPVQPARESSAPPASPDSATRPPPDNPSPTTIDAAPPKQDVRESGVDIVAGPEKTQPVKPADTPPRTRSAPASSAGDAEKRTQRLEATRILRRAQDYLDVGDPDGAAAEMAKAQKIDPSHPGLPKVAGDIDTLKRLEDARRIKRSGER